jgi:hypothetical protein
VRRLPSIAARPDPAAPPDDTAILGRGHPLVRVVDAVQVAIRQWTVAAVILLGSGVALVDGRTWGAPLAVAAAIVLAILTIVVLSLRQRRRDLAIDLIIDGREDIPIPAVRHEYERLTSKRTRQALTRTFEGIVEDVTRPPRLQLRGSQPLYHRTVVARASPELQSIAGLLKIDASSARGIARAERVITGATSPLYGCDPRALREELRHVIDLLSKRSR